MPFPTGMIRTIGGFSLVAAALFVEMGCEPKTLVRPPTAEPVFYPALPDTPRIQYLTRLRSSHDIERPSWFRKMVLGQPPARSLAHAYGVAMRDGIVYVCDTRSGAVITFDLGEAKMGWVRSGAKGTIVKPQNIAIHPDGTKYVVDVERNRIAVLDTADEVVRFFSDEANYRPVDVAVWGDTLYLADMLDKEIQMLDRETGEILGAVGGPGEEEGLFSTPTAISTDYEGNLFVTDLLACRVLEFASDGSLVTTFGQSGRLPGDFARPKGIAADRSGNIYVSDVAYENVQVFNGAGQILMFFGGFGDEDGKMWLPSDIFLDYDPEDIAHFSPYVAEGWQVEYLILVANQIGPSHIGVYGFLRPEE